MNYKPILALFLILSMVLVPIVAAVSYTPVNYVSDYAEIIDENYEAQINALAGDIEHNTTIEIAVLTVPSLDGGDIDLFAVETFHDWKVGKKDVNNGLLIVVAVEDHQWRIEVGYGLEPIITDAMAGRIGRANFVDNFRVGEYGTGIYGAVTDIQKIIENDPDAISAYSDSGAEINEFKEIGIMVLPLLLFVTLTCIYVAFCGWIYSKYNKESSTLSATKKPRLGSPKTILLKLAMLIVFSVAVWYFSNWILGVNFIITNLILTLTGKPIKGGNLGGGGGFMGGSGGFSGFGGFGGGRSGGGGASGGW